MKKTSYFNAKNFYIIICLLFIHFVFFDFNFAFYYKINRKYFVIAYQSDVVSYAKVNDACLLYKSQSLSSAISNIYFYVPNTYFVSIISKVSDSIYRVQYDNFVGYVSSDSIDVVSFVPSVQKPANITFDISQKSGTQIWSLPSDVSGNILTTISADTKNIEYVASATGDIPVGGTTNIWYYARFTPASSTTSVYEGYIYSEATINLSHIPNNLEYEPTEIVSPEKQIHVDSTAQIIMISLICLPFLILLVLAILKTANHIKERKQKIAISKKDEVENEISIAPKQFVRKKKANNTVEVVFPEYNYIDDDDLL